MLRLAEHTEFNSIHAARPHGRRDAMREGRKRKRQTMMTVGASASEWERVRSSDWGRSCHSDWHGLGSNLKLENCGDLDHVESGAGPLPSLSVATTSPLAVAVGGIKFPQLLLSYGGLRSTSLDGKQAARGRQDSEIRWSRTRLQVSPYSIICIVFSY